MSGPTDDKLIRVDMTKQTVTVEDFPDEWKILGGRALSAKLLLAECDPTCDPLGPDNVLVFAPGVLAGTAAPTSGRISVGAKSPLTGAIKEANSGGNPGQHLMKLGYRAVVVTGQPSDAEKRYGIEVDGEGVRVVGADDLKMKWNYATCEALAGKYSKTASFITIGPAGEQLLKGASVATTDQDNRYPARHAARGGLGAVMGSKGLKYLSVDPARARVRQPADKAAFGDLIRNYTKAYQAGPQMFKEGTASVVTVANMLNTFPTRNRTSGQSEHVKALEGKRIIESFETNGGGMHNCMTGCIVQCSNVVHGEDGEYKTSALEFETITLLGANCDLDNMMDVADLDRLCDEMGLDTIEAGAAIGVYMDAGEMEFGDAEGAKRLLREVAEGTEVGKLIGNGTLATGTKLGHKRIPVVKGQALPAWDPRPLKATGVTYATSPMGADHTAGLIVNPGAQPEEYAQLSQEAQIVNAVCDTSGFCQFLQPTLDDIRAFYGALYGEEVTREQIADQGWQCLEDEWEFNNRAGFTQADDDLPDCMREDPIGPMNLVWDVPQEIVQAAKKRLPAREELFAGRATG
ncbi:MAG: aldehyde ferredoxin oxidoreductase [Deltaproteobacteria bacterium]|nr:aldehyde ferredoxin oxidoreductase [Deltaproteobacteria bacterium]MBW2414952.1 aldehyde ferredoxin oxidoreductase [Deltaproteobacteria bacterium]